MFSKGIETLKASKSSSFEGDLARLFFNRASGRIIAFTELGEINEEVNSLERSLGKKEKSRTLASHCPLFDDKKLFQIFQLTLLNCLIMLQNRHLVFKVSESIGFNIFHALLISFILLFVME